MGGPSFRTVLSSYALDIADELGKRAGHDASGGSSTSRYRLSTYHRCNALLGKLAGEPDEGNADASKDRRMAFGAWTEENLQQLSAAPRASAARIAEMLDLLSQSPGQPIGYAEIAKSLGITHGELQGALSGFTRWIRSIWGDDDGWPMAVTYRRAETEGQDTESY
jgi:hypothetical protein